jgi:acyl-CoA reductase-like NAD-dependent aldehyde dehydrogenase
MGDVVSSPSTEEHVTVESNRKRAVAIGAAVALAVAGGGAAYAAATGADDRDGLLRDAAQRLNVTPGELRSALEGAFGDQLDDAVREGKLTQEQADQLKQRIARYGLPLGGPVLDGPGHHHFGGPMGGPGHGPLGIGLDAAADYLGLTEAQLARRLMNSRTLAEVARAEGKSVDGLEQALVDAAKSRLDRAVADRKLTSEQRDRILRAIEEHVDELVNGRAPGPFGRHDWRRDRGMGPGGPGMPPPPGAFPGHP